MMSYCDQFNGSLPMNMIFNSEKQFKVVAYSLMFVVAFAGNVGMFVLLVWKLRKRFSKVHLLLLHLNISDLIVTLHNMPKEVAHSSTVAWEGPGWLCRTCKFMDVFGVYLSSNVLITISIDRFWSIIFPLRSLTSRGKVKTGLGISWGVAALSSLPQLFLFEKAFHPCFPSFGQCVQSSFLGHLSPMYDLFNTLLNFLEIYLLPFVVICVCYGAILCRMLSVESAAELGSARPSGANSPVVPCTSPAPTLRRSHNNIEQAKQKTFKMTISIVCVFLFCWTPYFVTALIHFLDTDFATGKKLRNTQVPAWIAQGFTIFSTLSSVINPYLYGYFSINVRREFADLYASFRGRLPGTSTAHMYSQSSSVVRFNSIRERERTKTLLAK